MDVVLAAGVTTLFEETFYGVGNEKGTWFNENAAESGICGVLDGVSAATASKAPGPGRRSVVAHARHTLVHVEHVTNWLKGIKNKVDWKASFEPGTATDAEWAELRQRLRTSSRTLLATLVGLPQGTPQAVESSIGAIAHAAYHLGAIRQILARVNEP